MSEQVIKRVVPVVLLLHGLGHGVVLVAHILLNGRPEPTESGWRAAQSWLFPSLGPAAATALTSIFSVLSLIGFVAAAMAFWGVLVPTAIWRQLAVASAILSAVGIVLFLGTWAPPVNTLAAFVTNIAVLVALLWLRWPHRATLGK